MISDTVKFLLNDKIIEINNPIEQAKDAMFNFREKLSNIPNWNKNNCLHYICIFPGMRKQNVKSIGEFPTSLFLFKDDLDNIDQSLKRAFSFAGQKDAFDLFDSNQLKIFSNSSDDFLFSMKIVNLSTVSMNFLCCINDGKKSILESFNCNLA